MQNLVGYFWGTIVCPGKTFQRIHKEESISIGLTLVIVFGFLAGITYFVSYLYGASTTLEEVYAGNFIAEPFIPISKETYRLWESLFILPMYLTAWVLLAGSARFVAKTLGGKGSFKKILNVLGFAFFVHLYFFVVFDLFLIGPAYSWNLAAARGLYGPGIQSFASALAFFYIGFPFGIWAPLLTLIAIKAAERISLWKAVVVTLIAMIPSYALFTILIR